MPRRSSERGATWTDRPKSSSAAAPGVELIARGDPRYPPPLLETPDPPALLYARGTFEPRDQLAIALVGSRRCTSYGMRIAERLASSLARTGFTIVSGLARGIDAAAHQGALKAGGRTIAVLANGLEQVYPPEHAELAVEIAQHGVVLTELPMRQGPLAGLFPQRNRIISGLMPRRGGRRGGAAERVALHRRTTPWSRTARSSPCPARWTAWPAAAATA